MCRHETEILQVGDFFHMTGLILTSSSARAGLVPGSADAAPGQVAITFGDTLPIITPARSL